MTKPRSPIYWHHGLFMQPQHLQQASLYAESLLTPLKQYISPYFWGICALEIDQSALKDYKVELTEGEFLFRDGTWVAIGHNALIEARSFHGLWERLHEPFTVYIALKRLNPKGEDIQRQQELITEHGLPKARFTIAHDQDEVIDLYNHEHTTSVATINYILKLVWESEIDNYPEYELLPLARIEYNGQYPICSAEFAPPVVNLKSSPILARYLKNIKELLHSRSITLGSYKNLRKSLAHDYKPATLPYVLALKTIAHYAPLLQHLVESPNVCPWQAYGILRQLAGELSLLSEDVDILGRNRNGEQLILAYEHTNLGDCYKQVCILIDSILEAIATNIESVIPLIADGRYYKAEIPVDLLRDTNSFYLCIKSNLNIDELIGKVTHEFKTGSQEDIQILIKRALSGVPLVYLNEAPMGMARKGNVNYFLLNHHHPTWASIKEYANICIFLSEVPQQLEIDLLVLKGKDLLT